MLFCPSVNILRFSVFLENYCSYLKIMMELGFKNYRECKVYLRYPWNQDSTQSMM